MEGTITRIVEGKGFGFIHVPNEPDVFFHISQIADESMVFDESLIERRVKFDVIESEKGRKAVGVRAAD